MKKYLFVLIIPLFLSGCTSSQPNIEPAFDCRDCKKGEPCPAVCDEPNSYPEPDYWGR